MSRQNGAFIFASMNKAILILPIIFLTLIIAIWSGWIRIGINLPVTVGTAQHGSLMINGFLASLIFLERAVTFKSKWVLLLPYINASGLIAVAAGWYNVAHLIHIICAFGFMLMCALFIYKHKELYYYVFFAGAFCLLTGNIVLFKTELYPAAIIWWMQFLLFTIVAERLELSRFLPLRSSRRLLLMIILAVVLTTAFIPFHLQGNIVFALALSATAIWLFKYDMAFKSIKAKGQHRYSGTLLIVGYVWLILTSALLVAEKNMTFGYDAVLHSFFIGFVFSMIFSHAPIILPAVAKLPIKIYRPVLYAWFVVLQVSLIARIIADFSEQIVLRKWAGMINGIAILLFFVTIIFIVRQELLKRKHSLAKS
jgi:hypothetical protein